MALATTTIGKTDLRTPQIGHGLMSMSIVPDIPDEQSFAALRFTLSQAGPGEKVVLNSSEMYGIPPNATHNLEMLSRFFTKYPELQEKAFVVVKGAFGIFPSAQTGEPEQGNSPSALRTSAEGIAKTLHPKRVDVFEPTRLDKSIPIEDIIRSLVPLQKEGLFDHIGLSECSAATVRRAVAIAPITTVEIEVSPMSWEEETKRVIAASKEVGATILAYSPIGRGALASQPWEELPPLLREMFPRYQEDTYKKNLALTDKLTAVAEKKGVSTPQLCIAWVMSQGEHLIPIPGSSKEARMKENFGAGRVRLTSQEKDEITALADAADIQGTRYPGALNDMNWG